MTVTARSFGIDKLDLDDRLALVKDSGCRLAAPRAAELRPWATQDRKHPRF